MELYRYQSHAWIKRIVEEYEQGRSLLFFFDYDGTLTPHQRSAEQLSSEFTLIFRELSRLPGITTHFLSDLSLDELRSALVAIDDSLNLVAENGMHLELQGEEIIFPHSESFCKVLEVVEDHLSDVLQKFPGSTIVRRNSMMRIEYGSLLPLQAICFRREINHLLEKLALVRFRDIEDAIEVTPMDAWDRGRACQMILDRTSDEKPFIVYWGDSLADLEGMQLAINNGGIAIGVGIDAPSIAEFLVQDSTQLCSKLEKLLLILKGEKTQHLHDSSLNLPVVPHFAHNYDGKALGFLLLDPDESHRQQLGRAMLDMGWSVWTCESLEQAKVIFQENSSSIQFLLADIAYLDGEDFSDFSSDNTPLLICVMSENIGPTMASTFRSISETPLFSKPMAPTKLDVALKRYLATSNSSVR